MSKSTVILQDVFLNLIRKDRTPVTLQLSDSTRVTGRIKGFDSYTVILEGESDRNQILIYKNAIAMISPVKAVLA